MVLETRKIEHVLCNCECRHSQTAFEALGELKKLKSELEQAECELRLLRVEAEVAANAVKQAERENELLIRERDEARDDAVSAHSDADFHRRRANAAEAQLVVVPALVEALRDFCAWDFDKEPSPLPPVTLLVLREDKESGLAALSKWEQAQGEKP